MSENQIKYAGFNRRGWASTIDSIIAYFTTDKIVCYILTIGSPQKVSELPDISVEQVLNFQNDPNAAAAMLNQLASSMNEATILNSLTGYAL